MTPTKGRIVFYQDGWATWPAIVVDADPEACRRGESPTVDLWIFGPVEEHYVRAVFWCDTKPDDDRGHQAYWPPRVP